MRLLLDFSIATGIVVTIIILVLLFKRKSEDLSTKILISIFSFFLLVFIHTYAYIHKIAGLFWSTFIFDDVTSVIIGPLIYIYIKSLTGSTQWSLKNYSIHLFFPALYLLIVSIPLMISVKQDDSFGIYIQYLVYIIEFDIAYSFVYCILALRLLIRSKSLIKDNYSNLQNKNLQWVRTMLIGSIFIISIDISTSLYEIFIAKVEWNIGFLTVAPMVYIIIFLGYYGVSQSSILLPDFLLVERNIDSLEKNSQTTPEVLSNEEAEKLRLRLGRLMKEEKPYLIDDLTLGVLASAISTTDKKLSTVLNQYMNISFYDYVNSFRVSEIIEAMKDQSKNHLTLLGVAYDCGFKSKSSFNRVFKNITGHSPSVYKKRLENSSK